MFPNYPFAALVGQADLQAALLWLAVDPTIGGVLVTGTRGTAKSTAVRALADLLPPIRVLADDAFNRAPATASDEALLRPTPFVELPVGATEDRVIGTLDVRSLLTHAERRFEPGLLARAHRGVLYVDEVNLLPDHLVDVILDAAATGTNVVERDGASFAHEARIMLVGTMNPEEGELRPQLLDRFGLCVAIANDDDVDRRVEIVERRLAFELDRAAFINDYDAITRTLRDRVVRARDVLARVAVDRACLRHAAALAIAARVEGMRADLTIVRTARAIAALDGRITVTLADIDLAAVPALAHRRREAPRTSPPRPPAPPPPPPRSERSEDARDPAPASDGTAALTTFDVGAPASLGLAFEAGHPAAARRPQRFSARGRSAAHTPSGVLRVVRTATTSVAILATIRAAAADRTADDVARPLAVGAPHVRFAERRGRERQLVVFLVDASGSMAAAARMRAAKGVVCGLLEDAYHRRDAVALIAFRGSDADILVPPTRSAALAYRRLRAMPTGGRTPLASGLRRAREVMLANERRDPAARAHLVLISDARANDPHVGAFDAALREATTLRSAGVRALCIDTETGRVRLGNAARLADALDGTYRHLDACTERTLGAAVREWMAIA